MQPLNDSKPPLPGLRRLACGGLLWAVMATAACGSSPDEAVPEPETCYSRPNAPCDVLDSDCQQELMSLTACLRGSEIAELPPVRELTVEQYVDLVNQEIAADPSVDRTHWESTLVMLGLVVPGAFASEQLVAADVETLVGVYRSEQNEVILIDRGQPDTDAYANQVLVHELVHALQDLDYDLPSFFAAHATDYDSYLAAKSVAEGEAEYHGNRAGAVLAGLDPSAIDWDRRIASEIAWNVEWLLAQPSPFRSSYASVPYAYGQRLVHTAYGAGGYSEVMRLFASPPHAMQPLLADPEATAPFTLNDIAWVAPSAPAELTLDTWDTLGAWGLLLLLRVGGIAEADALASAAEWQGDRLWVYAAGDLTVGVFGLEMVNDAAAQTVEARLTDSLASLAPTVTRDGNRLRVAFSDDPTLLGDWATVP